MTDEPKLTEEEVTNLWQAAHVHPDEDALPDLVARMIAAAEDAACAEALADGWDEGLRFGTRYGASDTGDPYLASNPYRSAS